MSVQITIDMLGGLNIFIDYVKELDRKLVKEHRSSTYSGELHPIVTGLESI